MKLLVVVFVSTITLWTPSMAPDVSSEHLLLEGKKLLRQGSILNDKSLLLEGRTLLERAHELQPSVTTLYYLAQSEHELVRVGLAEPESDLFDRYYESAVRRAQEVIRQREEWSEGYALLSSLYGLKIARSWINAPVLGPRAYGLAEEAVRRDSANPRAWLVRGMMKLNAPAVFGGSAEEALESFQRSIALFEGSGGREALEPDWGYIDAIVWFGWAQQKEGRLAEAMSAYEKALKVEPRAAWVRQMFIIPLEKKISDAR
jgi:tetratricopeptide (TPR) repeat protein